MLISLIFVISIIIIVMLYRIGNNKRKIMWPILILRYSLPILCFGFYGQIFLMFTTIFYCRKSESSTSPYLKCRPGHWFNKIKPIAGIAMFLNFLIAFITNTLYYKPIFMRSDEDFLKKSDSLPDVLLLFTKMIIISIFIFDKGVESEHWAILSFLVFVTGTNAYFTVFYKNRQNPVLLTLNNFFSLILFSGFLILFVDKIFDCLGFDGGIYLFFVFALLIVLYITLYKKSNKLITKDYKNISNPDEYLIYVSTFYNCIKNKNSSRAYLNKLQSIINSIEENCIISNCPLMKYLINLQKGFDQEYLLFQFCEKLFQYGISKFNGNIFLKNHYSIFLINEMNDKKKALINLEGINYNIISLQTNYNIYRCRRIIETYSSPFISKNNSILNHREDVNKFKTHVKNCSFLYVQFLSLLLESKIQDTNNLNEINELGHQIVKLNKKIDDSFNNIIKTKTDNLEVIKLYSDFVENILKDEEKIIKCKNLKKILHNTNFEDIHENDYTNFNLDYLKGNPNTDFLIISTKNKNLGIIIDCSMNICNIFGYTKKELIGSHINILIPEIFHQRHNSLMIKNTEKSKLNFFEGLCKNTIYAPSFIQKEIYCITKTKFLIPINIKIYLVNSEENDLVYIAEIEKKISINKDLLSKITINPEKFCILTDTNFLIQSFTPNCLYFLNINYEDISCNCSIINYIKQFREDYLSSLTETSISRKSQMKTTGVFFSEKSIIDKGSKRKIPKIKKKKMKTELFNNKYNKKCKITWNASEKNSSNLTKEVKEIIKTSSIIFGNSVNYLKSKLLNESGIDIYMEPKKIILGDELIGYYFFFSKIFKFENKNYLKYQVVDKTGSNTSIKLKKAKKYQCTFKSIEVEKNINKVLNNLEKRSKRNSVEKLISRVKFKDEEKNQMISVNEKSKKHSKYSSTHEMVEVTNEEDIIIDENFVPNSILNFAYDFKNTLYSISKNVNNNKILNESLKFEANDIIKAYTELKIKKNKNKKSEISNSFESSYEAESDYESKDYSSLSFKSKSKSNIELIEKSNNKESVSQENTLIKEKNENENHIEHKINTKINNIVRNSGVYHKINLTNLHYMIYDFNKDSIVEIKEKNSISKIEEIIKDLSENNHINLGKDANYPFIHLKSKMEINEGKEDKKSEEKLQDNYIEKESINKEEKIIKEKIEDAINNNKDELSVKNLKLCSLVSYIILAIFGISNIYIYLYFFTTFKEIFELIQASLYIKNCENIGIYYVKETALLSFNFSEIKGGEYINFPAKNKKNYLSLVKSKINELFIENQNSIEKILFSDIYFSKSTKKLYKENVIKAKLFQNGEDMEELFNLIVEYNNDFYYFVLTINGIKHNDENVNKFIENNFNKYKIAIQLLVNIYENELSQNKEKSIIYSIIYMIFIFIINLIVYYYISKYFKQSNKKRMSYIKILYGINSNILRMSIQESLNLINNLKDPNENNDFEFEEDNNIVGNNLNLIDNKEGKNRRISSENINSKQINNNNTSNVNNLFFVLFGILLLLLYFCFIFYIIYLLNLFKKADKMISFCYYFELYQNQILDMFNVYREYLYNNNSMILNYKSIDYLRILEDEIYDSITEQKKITEEYIEQLLISNPQLIQILEDMNFCKYNVTDYFDSSEECSIIFQNFLNRDFYFFSNYFLEEIKIGKNIVRYKNKYENIVGNLDYLEATNFTEQYQNEVKKNNSTEFRLNLFNDEIIHSKLNAIFINYLLPYIRFNRKTFLIYISIDGEQNIFIILSIVYFIALSIIYFGAFLLISKILNVQINKAKNMISIIPITVLTSQGKNNSINDLFAD